MCACACVHERLCVYGWDNSSFINHIYHYSCFFSVFIRKCSKFAWIYWTRSCLHTYYYICWIHNIFVWPGDAISFTFFHFSFVCLLACFFVHMHVFVFIRHFSYFIRRQRLQAQTHTPSSAMTITTMTRGSWQAYMLFTICALNLCNQK